MQEKPYTVAALAEHWQCSDTFIYDLLNSGQLEGFKLGGKLWRIKPGAVEAYEARDSVCTLAVQSDVLGDSVSRSRDRTAMRMLRLSLGKP